MGRVGGGEGGPAVPEEIIFYDVLPRLPAKVLIRFRCVSKRWRALITRDARFLRLQSSRARSSPALLLFGETPEPVFLLSGGSNPPGSTGFPDICSQLRFGGPRPKWLPLAACGEFLCAATTSDLDGGMITQLYLGNPARGDWRPLPAPPRWAPRNAARMMGLAVYDTPSGMAYDLFVPFWMKSGPDRVEATFRVLSSTGRFWRMSHLFVVLNAWAEPFQFECNVCVEGIYFWRVTGEVLWLDPKEERGGTIPLPYADADADECWTIGEWGGELSFMRLIHRQIHIWSWSWNRSSWSFRILLAIETIAQGNSDLFASVGLGMDRGNHDADAEPLDIIKFGRTRTRQSIFAFGVGLIVLRVNFHLLCCDPTTGKAWKLNPPSWGYEGRTRPFAYINSLRKLTTPL